MRTRNGTRVASAGLAAIAVTLVAGTWAGAQSPAAELKTAKIGILAPITGEAAADGEEMVRSAQVAADAINAAGGAGGYRLEIVSADTQDQRPDAVTSAVQRLLSDPDINMIMTGYASGTNFEIDQMAEAGIPYILAANSAQTRDIISKDPSKYPTVWSFTPSYDAYETELPLRVEQWIADGKFTPTNRKVYIVTSDNPYSSTISDGLTKSFTEAGWTVVGGDKVPFGPVNDWRTILSKIRAEAPDLVVNTDYLPGNDATFMTQFMEDPINSLVFMQYGPSVPEFVDLTKDQSNGVLYNLLISPIPGERATELSDRYKAANGGAEGGVYSVALQEMVEMYGDALTAVGDATDRAAISAWVGSAEKDTALGHIKFDPATHLAVQGEDYFPILFFQLENQGERVLIWPDQYASGEFQLPPWFK